jgi:hypothetical protein
MSHRTFYKRQFPQSRAPCRALLRRCREGFLNRPLPPLGAERVNGRDNDVDQQEQESGWHRERFSWKSLSDHNRESRMTRGRREGQRRTDRIGSSDGTGAMERVASTIRTAGSRSTTNTRAATKSGISTLIAKAAMRCLVEGKTVGRIALAIDG